MPRFICHQERDEYTDQWHQRRWRCLGFTSYHEALQLVAGLNDEDSGWRLPTSWEYLTVCPAEYDTYESDPDPDPQDPEGRGVIWQGGQRFYWLDNTQGARLASHEGHLWAFDRLDKAGTSVAEPGSLAFSGKDYVAWAVRLVAGIPLSARLESTSSGTFHDVLTGLEWWPGLVKLDPDYSPGSIVAGPYHDWRLPGLHEACTIVDHEHGSCLLPLGKAPLVLRLADGRELHCPDRSHLAMRLDKQWVWKWDELSRAAGSVVVRGIHPL